jgi:uncharacterized protein
MKVLLTGATGLVGREVGKKLVLAGHEVLAVSRNAERANLELPFPCLVIEGDLTIESIRNDHLKSVQAVIHLAGESVAESRWSNEKKNKIYQSRVRGTANLIDSLSEARAPLQAFVSTSASGFYGDRKNEILIESSNQGSGFLSDVCRDWERSVEWIQRKDIFPGCRIAILRVGMVVSALGGALPKMIPAFQRGVGGRIGSGEQWMGWIHLEDLSDLYVKALKTSEISGVINAVAPETLQNREFSQILAESLGKKLGPAVPAWALKAIFGEMSHVLLSSQRIEAQVLHRLQFSYKYPSLKEALQEVTSYYQNGESFVCFEQYLPFPRQKVFSFFAEVQNLETITPPLLKFQVKKMSTEGIQKGSLIDYRLKIRGLPLRWQTEILEWKPPESFIDSQLKGPYTVWHHTHSFSDMGAGTLMSDKVRYKLPLGALGFAIAGRLVANDVRKIFSYRREVCSDQTF